MYAKARGSGCFKKVKCVRFFPEVKKLIRMKIEVQLTRSSFISVPEPGAILKIIEEIRNLIKT